jgi:hypothetical protein
MSCVVNAGVEKVSSASQGPPERKLWSQALERQQAAAAAAAAAAAEPAPAPAAGPVVSSEAELRAAVAKGGTVVVRAGATIELQSPLEIKTACALVAEPGSATPTLRCSDSSAIRLRGKKLQLEPRRG